MDQVSSPQQSAVPASVTNAIRMVWIVVGLTGLTALLTALFRDDLVLTWAAGNPDARALVESGGLQALEASAITIPEFTPLAVALFVTFAAFALVLVAFFRGGHNWARLSIAGLVLFATFVSVLSIVRGLPPVFLALAVVSLLAYAVLLWLLFHKDTSAFIKGY